MSGALNCFEALRPLLDSQSKRELDAINRIMEAFPGRTLSEIAKDVSELKARSGNPVEDTVEFLSSRVGHATPVEVETLKKSLNKLSVADLKRIAKELQLPCAATKTRIVSDLDQWFRSGGEFKPATESSRIEEKMRTLVNQAKPLYEESTPESAARLLNLIRATKFANKAELEAFAKGIGITVSGSKQQMSSQLESTINRRAVTHVQTRT